MSIELMINRLTGQAESGDGERLSEAESRALAQRLRALVNAEGGEPATESPDQGPAAEALKLAAYLDRAMEPAERAAFEQELVRSPTRRDELMDAAAWLDTLAARQEAPPADVTELALALDAPARPLAQPQPRGFAAFLDWLMPRRRLALATSALASLAIAVVGLDITLHLMSQRLPQSQQVESDSGPPVRTFNPIIERSMQPGQPARLLLTAETINAMLAYQADPSDARRADVLRALTRVGAPAFDVRNVRAIAVQPKLAERLRQRDGRLPATISASLSLDGTLRLESAD